MIRREIWTVSGTGEYLGKPRPVLVIQQANYADLRTVYVCPFTTFDRLASPARVPVQPSEENGLRDVSDLMIDKVTPVRREKFGSRVGVLSAEDMTRVNAALAAIFGLAD